jgi:hypothetical protein
MATVKYYNSSTSQWEPILYGAQGDTGSTGATGATNSLSIGTVTNGLTAGASITGSAPSQTLNLVLPLNANAIDANSIQTITNKVITFADNTLTGVASTSTSQTLTNKTIAFGSNSISGTLAEFNTALTNADFATLAGTEILTNKSINLTNNTLTGTIAQFNTALSDADFVTLAGTETLTNKTLASPTITIGGTNVSATEISYLDGVTSAIQTQINTKTSTGKAIAMAIVFGG